jgi:hypothetical protein
MMECMHGSIPGMLLSFLSQTYHALLSSIATAIFITLEYISKKEEPQETQLT